MFNGMHDVAVIPYDKNCLVFWLPQFFLPFSKDTFSLSHVVNGTQKTVPLNGKGIAWWTDYNVKFRNPNVTPLINAFNGTTNQNELCISLELALNSVFSQEPRSPLTGLNPFMSWTPQMCTTTASSIKTFWSGWEGLLFQTSWNCIDESHMMTM